MIHRRTLLQGAAALPLSTLARSSSAQTALAADALQRLKRGGVVLIMRHADTTPGTGDPSGFQLYDCSTQRNLIDEGRAKARLLGEALSSADVRFNMVMSSEWCRCVETANIVFGVQPGTWPALNYTFPSSSDEQRAHARVKAMVAGWKGPDNLALVTHTQNVAALTGRSPAWNQAFVVVPIKGNTDVIALDLN